MTIEWPCHVLMPQNVAFDLVPRSLAAPASVSGLGQVVASDAGTWKATFGNVIVRNRQQVLAHRALSALLEGRLVPVLVPLCGAYQPFPDGLPDDWRDGVPHSDEASFSDGAPYGQGDVNSILVTSAAPARATTINVIIEFGGIIEAGQHFSIGERLYRLRTVTFTTATTAAITFRPPLREAAVEGTYLNFDSPVCRMKLLEDQGMDLALTMHRFGSPTVEFVEDL